MKLTGDNTMLKAGDIVTIDLSHTYPWYVRAWRAVRTYFGHKYKPMEFIVTECCTGNTFEIAINDQPMKEIDV